MSAPWPVASMELAEREKRALVTVIDGHVAVVLPKSVARVDSDGELAKLLAKVTAAIESALSTSTGRKANR